MKNYSLANAGTGLLCLTLLSACGGTSPTLIDSLPPVPGAPTTPTVKVTDFAVPEGAASETSVIQFRVNMAPASDATVTLDYLTEDIDALAGEDYVASAGSISFAPGETEKTIAIDVIGDGVEEAKEQFSISLSNIRGADAGDIQAIGTIANDDSPCELPPPGSTNPWMEPERLLLNYSHRGGAEDYPENTLYSYKKSVEINAHVLEMDVYEYLRVAYRSVYLTPRQSST